MKKYKYMVCGQKFEVEDGVEAVCPICNRIGEILTSPSTPRSVPFGTARFNSLHELSDSGLTGMDIRVGISQRLCKPSN